MCNRSKEREKMEARFHSTSILFYCFYKVSCNDLLEHETVSATEETQTQKNLGFFRLIFRWVAAVAAVLLCFGATMSLSCGKSVAKFSAQNG